jgi:hypothetical protein
MHVNMEVPQGKHLCSYLKQPKMSFFLLLFLYKEQERRTGPVGKEGAGDSGNGEEVGKW